MDNWFRKHDPRTKSERDARKQRLDAVESITRRQNSGEISKEQASLEFDEMLMASDPYGTLIYYSDSTGLTMPWNKDVMAFPDSLAVAASLGMNPLEHRKLLRPSNTGIFVRGPQRGFLITEPAGERSTAHLVVLRHFLTGSKGWIGAHPDDLKITPEYDR